MLLEIKNSQIELNDKKGKLESVEINQLAFWGVKKEQDGFYRGDFDEEKFTKIINYLDKKTKVELLETASAFLSKVNSSKQEILRIRDIGYNYKAGNFNNEQFKIFDKTLKSILNRPLKRHQVKAAYHLYLLKNAANFSVPGSGKTSVILSVYEKLRQEGKVNCLFVVGPPSSFGSWKDEFSLTLGRESKAIILAGNNKADREKLLNKVFVDTPELYLTTFQSMLSDQDSVGHFFSRKLIKAFFIIDEAHYIKQVKGVWASAILKNAAKAEYRCALTGTPMPKSFQDIFNLLDFLWPNSKILSSNDRTKIISFEQRNQIEESLGMLEKKVSPFFYRVRKKELGLSKQNFITLADIEMNKYERLVYSAIYTKIKEYSKKDYLNNIQLVNNLGRGRMIRLRQSLSFIGLLKNAIKDYDEVIYEDAIDLQQIIENYQELELPGKFERLFEYVGKLQKEGKKVVIWSNFIKTINFIEAQLNSHGYYCKKIFGQIPIEKRSYSEEQTREEIKNEFIEVNSGLDILIANPAACAESISLHKTCHNAIYYDLNYNCAQYLQSLDRIHRVGGSERIEPNYYFFQYRNTMEDDIKENLDRKADKMYNLINGNYPVYSMDMFDEENDDIAAYKRLFGEDDE